MFAPSLRAAAGAGPQRVRLAGRMPPFDPSQCAGSGRRGQPAPDRNLAPTTAADYCGADASRGDTPRCLTFPCSNPPISASSRGAAHVCASGEPPSLLHHDAALRQYGIDKSIGMPRRARLEAQVDRARDLLAAMWCCAAGDEAVVDAHEYPSIVLPFALRRHPTPVLRAAAGPESL